VFETTQRFTTNPFNPPARLYHTGDLARWNTEGQLEFIGRADRQVKVRGYRVELQEVECALLEIPGVIQAVVVSSEDARGDDRLVAYLQTAGPEEPSPSDVRRILATRLPAHMIPATSSIVRLDRFPLTATGKIDMRALPAPSLQRPELATEFAPVESGVQRRITAIWERELGVSPIGLDDDFIELGGDSFGAIRVVAQVNETFGVNIPLRVLLGGGTVRSHAEAVAAHMNRSRPVAEPSRQLEINDVQLDSGLHLFAPHAAELRYLYRDVVTRRTYERNGVVLPRDGWVVDVGAHVGLFAHDVAARSGAVHVLALEPAPPLADCLRRNVANFGPRVKVMEVAAAERSGMRSITYYPRLTGMSSLHTRLGEDRSLIAGILRNIATLDGALVDDENVSLLVDDVTSDRLTFEVQATTLSLAFEDIGSENISLLKIDVQGMEESVMAGMTDADWRRIPQVVIEVHDLNGALDRIVARLREMEFNVVAAQDDLHAGTAVHFVYAVK
jgi:FkbM family methyltransferase